MTLLAFHRRAGSAHAGEPDIPITAEPPGPWLTAEQNSLLAVRHAAGGAPDADTESILDSRTGFRMLEVFAAILSVEWG